ncbi:MAG: adenine phosphoribosyltransferase [Candidatus Binatia bacterium]
MTDLKALIRNIPDFPKPGIVFRDITPLVADGPAWRETVGRIAERYRGRVDIVLGVESRGFLIGSAVAYALGCGIAVVRKPGKLPAAIFHASYALEYGTDTLEIHQDAFLPGSRVLVVDDLLATGGTAQAAMTLVRQLRGEVVEAAFIIELTFLNGRQCLAPHEVFSLIQYDSE